MVVRVVLDRGTLFVRVSPAGAGGSWVEVGNALGQAVADWQSPWWLVGDILE